MLAAFCLTAVLSAAPQTAPLKLAAPGLQAVDVDPKKAQFLNDLFAEQLGRKSDARIRVITQAEVAALIGFERQKELLGCSNDGSSCLAEISGALGVDALVVGNVAKFGESYAMTLRVIAAGDGHVLASASNTGMREEQLLDWVKWTASDFVKVLDPGAPAETTKAAVSALPRDDNSIWLSFLGVQYEHRLRGGPSWVGARATASAGFAPRYGMTGQWDVLAMARYSPLPPGYKWNWSAFTGVGIGGWQSIDEAIVGATGFTATLGIEGGFQGFRASAEVMSIGGQLILVPGLSIALTF